MSEYPWNEKNNTFTLLRLLYNPFKFFRIMAIVGVHSLSTYAIFSEKLTFFTPWYAAVRVRIMS